MHYTQRFKSLLLFFILSVFTTYTWSFNNNNLSGIWYHNGQSTSIQKINFNQYRFCNENGDCAKGTFINESTIQVPKWSVSGILNYYPKAMIQWSNGTKWVRFKHHYNSNINGQWFHKGQPTQIRLNRDGRSFFLTNEMGQTTIGFINGNTLTLPSLNVVGQLSRRGDQIRWSNNTIWTRN